MVFSEYFATVIAKLESDILPTLTEVEATITPGITAAQLTTTLEAKVSAYASAKWGAEVGEVLVLLPSVKTKLDAVIAAAVARAMPVIDSPVGQRIIDGNAGITSLSSGQSGSLTNASAEGNATNV